MTKPTHYAHRGSSGAVSVKEAEFFIEQGGLTALWGSRWRPVIATSLEHARILAERYLKNDTKSERQPLGSRNMPPIMEHVDYSEAELRVFAHYETYGTVTGRLGPKVGKGEIPLNADLSHRLLDVIKEGILARDKGTTSPYRGHSLEHCLHATGWVQRDLQLALDEMRCDEFKELIVAIKAWSEAIDESSGRVHEDGTPKLGKWEPENLYRKAKAFLRRPK